MVTRYTRKAALFSNQNALHYRLMATKLPYVLAHVQTVNIRKFLEYPSYNTRDSEEKPLCSPNKALFIIEHSQQNLHRL